ncbi:limonene-1,2-epoxide hydrolase family protein [Amycolatopsis sp. FDAARGOS 1241]|uniref:limonene-1,2-epoxide hydrolase family protein n=1 Tax=Amycolatopsis sp. FDAARGOS 1241 TaxID=2778070 RepID=UPI0019527B4F|nr:limonene-1,2-epoxide hydrolase family protein [Amycolatopsis sp. FDAARGOS 1241]QRP46443.1 nuclear transport factor 2 family protein [Amycolatopsis sp. FDAARGOS 1241]
MTEPKAVVTAFLQALEDLDIDRALNLVAVDITYQNVPLPAARGLAAVEKQLRLLTRFGTGFEARTHHIAADGNVVLTERTDVLRRGSFEAEFWVCGTFEVENGRIVLWRDYFDWTTLFAASAKGAGRAAVTGAKTLIGKYRS